jgi:hypothetical protein
MRLIAASDHNAGRFATRIAQKCDERSVCVWFKEEIRDVPFNERAPTVPSISGY